MKEKDDVSLAEIFGKIVFGFFWLFVMTFARAYVLMIIWNWFLRGWREIDMGIAAGLTIVWAVMQPFDMEAAEKFNRRAWENKIGAVLVLVIVLGTAYVVKLILGV